MKNPVKVSLALLIVANSLMMQAQKLKVELVPLVGYIFQSTYYGYDGRIEFSDGMAVGGLINFKPNEFVEVGLNVISQGCTARLIYSSPLIGNDASAEVGLINYQLSLVRNFVKESMPKIVPFAGFDIGAIQVYEKTETGNDFWKMSVGIKGGLKIYLSETVNLRIQPQLEMPIQGVGVGIGIGTGGASAGASTWSSMVQFGVIGGLGFTLGGKKQAAPAPDQTAPASNP